LKNKSQRKSTKLHILLITILSIIVIYLGIYFISFIFYQNKSTIENSNSLNKPNTLYPLVIKNQHNNIFWIDETKLAITSYINNSDMNIEKYEIVREDNANYSVNENDNFEDDKVIKNFNYDDTISQNIDKSLLTTFIEIYDTNSRTVIKQIYIKNSQFVGLSEIAEIVKEDITDIKKLAKENNLDDAKISTIEISDNAEQINEKFRDNNAKQLIICNSTNNVKNSDKDFGTNIEVIYTGINIYELLDDPNPTLEIIGETEKIENEMGETENKIFINYDRKDFQIVPTLTISSCSGEEITLKSSYPFQEQKNYKYNISNMALEDIVGDEYSLTGQDDITIRKNEQIIFNVQKFNDIVDYSINPEANRVALISQDGTVYVFIK